MTRLPDSVSDSEREDRVQSLLKMLGIDHVKDSLVGNAMIKGISGGQKKRLSVAVEIVNLPNFIFLDGNT
jgi:ATP-binding cassette subfamily G (WHITE) protein 2